MVRGIVLLVVVGMPCVSVVGGNHKRLLDGAFEGFGILALRQGNASKQRSEEWAACTLLCLRSRFLVVEDGEYVRTFWSLGVCRQRLKACKAHREVVEAP